MAIKIAARNYLRGKFDLENMHLSNVLTLLGQNEDGNDGSYSLFNCFDYCFSSIDKRTRKCLSKLLIFESPFTEDAAREILDVSRSDLFKVYETGFLEKIDISERGIPLDFLFYDFHPLIREFLSKKKKEHRSYARLVHYYVELIRRAIGYDPFARAVFNSLITSYYLRNSLKILLRIVDYHTDQIERSKVSNQIGLLLAKLGFYEEARGFHSHSLEIDKQLYGRNKSVKYKKWIINDLRNIGLSYMKSNASLALEHCIEALNQGKLIGYTEPMQFLEIGNIYLIKNNLDEAFKFYIEGHENTLGKVTLQSVYSADALSTYYLETKNYLKSFGFIKMALKYLEDLNNVVKKEDYEECLSILLSNLARVYNRLGRTDLSVENLLRALQLDISYHNVHGVLRVYKNLALYFYQLERVDEGNEYYEKFLKLRGDLEHSIPIESSDHSVVFY
ncbi:MAG: tetratricopeptide repeat protein [Nitrososphaeraceae archaeon]